MTTRFQHPGQGDWWVWCSHGHRVPRSVARRKGNGQWVCPDHYEFTIKDQEYYMRRTEPYDDVEVPFSLRQHIVTTLDTCLTTTAIPNQAIPNCSIPNSDTPYTDTNPDG